MGERNTEFEDLIFFDRNELRAYVKRKYDMDITDEAIKVFDEKLFKWAYREGFITVRDDSKLSDRYKQIIHEVDEEKANEDKSR